MRKAKQTKTGRPPSGQAAPYLQSRRRIWLFRVCAAVLVPALVLGGAEVVLRAAGLGAPAAFFLSRDIQGRDCLIQNDRFGWRFLGRRMSRTPHPFVLPEAKAPRTVRVFVLGESAAYGDPQPAFGLSRVLEVLLRDRFPGLRFEVVNAAMTAINSHAILPIARDCARRRGDLWVLYMGNNEVVGPYGAGTVFGQQSPPLALIRTGLALKATRIGQVMDSVRDRLSRGPADPGEWGGMAMFTGHQVRPDDPRMEAVYAHFERNLSDILDAGIRSGTRVVVCTVAGNLRDCAPFGSLHRPDLSDMERAEWRRDYEAGVQAQKAGQPAQAADAFTRAGRIDETFADLQFRWAQCCLALGWDAEALRRFTLARDYDTLRFRSDTRLNDLVHKVCRGLQQKGIAFVDGQATLASNSPNGIVGRELLHEHVHLRFEGNYLLARAIADQAARLVPEIGAEVATPQPEWLSAEACAGRLALTDWDRYQALTSMRARLADPPFTSQLNHAEQCRRVQQEIEQVLPAVQPTSLERAAEVYREAVRLAPDDWMLHENQAYLLQRQGELQAAIESWRRVHQLLPHYAQALCQMGLLLATQGQGQEAVQALQEALRMEPDSFVALDGMAHALADQGRHAEAVRYYARALRLKPMFSPSHLGMAVSLKALGRDGEADAHIRQAAQHPLNTAAALKAVAKACMDQGWMDQAVTHFTKALGLDPTDAVAHLHLGEALAALGRRGEAQAHYAEAVHLNPGLPEAHFRMGYELGRQGKDAEAMGYFREALRIKPDFLEARLNLGVALMLVGRTDEAIEHLQAVLQVEPNHPTALRHLKKLQDRAQPVR